MLHERITPRGQGRVPDEPLLPLQDRRQNAEILSEREADEVKASTLKCASDAARYKNERKPPARRRRGVGGVSQSAEKEQRSHDSPGDYQIAGETDVFRDY